MDHLWSKFTQFFRCPILVVGITCNNSARWYIEPVGWGIRSKVASEYDIKGLLIVKPSTQFIDATHGINAQGTIAQDIINAAQVSFNTNVKTWLENVTDGRVTWSGTSVVANEPIRSLNYDPANPNTNYLPTAADIPNDVQRFVPRGVYDTAQVFFTGGNVSGGWGWGPGRSPQSNYTLWTTVNGGTTAASAWLSTTSSEPTEVFIHEMMHGFDSHYDQLGVLLPEGYLHAVDINRYNSNAIGWMHWYRDYLLGTVIASNDTYRGYGPRMFRLEKVRNFAARQPSSTIKITQNISGKCLATKSGVTTPSAGTEVVFSANCNSGASSFQLNANGMLEFKGNSATGTGYCVHPAGGTANVGTPLVLWPACSDLGLPVQITDQGSIQNIARGLCIHPSGGSSNPAEGTNAVYWSGCDGDYLRFKFNRY